MQLFRMSHIVIGSLIIALAPSVADAQKIYRTDVDANTIQRANLDRSNVEVLLKNPLERPRRIAVDLTGGKMCWADLGKILQR